MAKEEMSPGCLIIGGILVFAPVLTLAEKNGAIITFIGLLILGVIIWYQSEKGN